jgi:hypothetical protein
VDNFAFFGYISKKWACFGYFFKKMGIFSNFLVNLIRALWVRPGAYLLKVEQLKGASLG